MIAFGGIAALLVISVIAVAHVVLVGLTMVVAVSVLGSVLLVLGFPFSVPTAMLVSVLAVLWAGSGLFDMARRLKTRIGRLRRSPRKPPNDDSPEPWTDQDAALDAALSRQIDAQLAECNTYRTEVLQLTGFTTAHRHRESTSGARLTGLSHSKFG